MFFLPMFLSLKIIPVQTVRHMEYELSLFVLGIVLLYSNSRHIFLFLVDLFLNFCSVCCDDVIWKINC